MVQINHVKMAFAALSGVTVEQPRLIAVIVARTAVAGTILRPALLSLPVKPPPLLPKIQ